MEYQNNTNPLTANGVPGKWTHEFYADIGGGRVADLKIGRREVGLEEEEEEEATAAEEVAAAEEEEEEEVAAGGAAAGREEESRAFNAERFFLNPQRVGASLIKKNALSRCGDVFF